MSWVCGVTGVTSGPRTVFVNDASFRHFLMQLENVAMVLFFKKGK